MVRVGAAFGFQNSTSLQREVLHVLSGYVVFLKTTHIVHHPDLDCCLLHEVFPASKSCQGPQDHLIARLYLFEQWVAPFQLKSIIFSFPAGMSVILQMVPALRLVGNRQRIFLSTKSSKPSFKPGPRVSVRAMVYAV